MNSVGGKIVYECVSQRDLSVIWPDEPPHRPAYKSSQLSVSGGTPLQDYSATCGYPDAQRSPLGISRITSLVTSLWKNPRRYRWVLTFVVSFMFALILGFISSFGALYMCLRRDLHSSATGTGWVASLAWSLCLLSPLITVVYQRLGPRLISILGIIFCFVGLFASTFAHDIWVLYLTFGTLFGLGVNFVFVSSINLVTSFFDAHECTMPTTLPGVGATTGMLVFSPVLEIVFARFGWRASLRVIASIILVFGLAGSMFFRLPSCFPSASSSSPSEGSPTTTRKDEKRLEKLHLKELELREKRERMRKSKDNYKLLLRDPMHWIFAVAILLTCMALLCNVINLPLKVFATRVIR